MPKLSLLPAIAFLSAASAAVGEMAPPPAAPAVNVPAVALRSESIAVASPTAPQLYSIGNPTNEEQLYLEDINRARANPTAEGQRLAATNDPDVVGAYRAFAVNLLLMQTQLAALIPMPPLSMNGALTDAARAHSQDMFTWNYQGHVDRDGTQLGARIASYLVGANGYGYAENVFAYSRSVFYGHAGFEVDWGGTAATGGMQSPAGHRLNIHGNYREIGIGMVLGSNGGVGPQLVTQDFGLRYDTKPFVTGVVFADRNGNGFYDGGEGIGGVNVTVSGSGFYAVTAGSGGYSVPVPGDGSYAVNFSGGGVAPSQQTATVFGGNNVKSDYVAATLPLPTPTPTPPAGTRTVLGNISTRSVVGTGDNVLIGGFIITGTQTKKIIVRAIAPSLSLADKLGDPILELHDSGGRLIVANDNWNDSANRPEIIASTVAPTDPLESAVVANLAPGSYTAVVRGANNTTGTAVIDAYDLDLTVDSKLANISTRALVQTGDRVLIGGFYVVGQLSQKVIVRAIGTSLPIANALADPTLELRDGSGTLVLANDNWRSTQQAEIIASTVPPTSDNEAAVVATLPPGPYTAIVRGSGNTTGVAVVEIYALN